MEILLIILIITIPRLTQNTVAFVLVIDGYGLRRHVREVPDWLNPKKPKEGNIQFRSVYICNTRIYVCFKLRVRFNHISIYKSHHCLHV